MHASASPDTTNPICCYSSHTGGSLECDLLDKDIHSCDSFHAQIPTVNCVLFKYGIILHKYVNTNYFLGIELHQFTVSTVALTFF